MTIANTAECRECHRIFYQKHGNQRFCSKDCLQASRNRRYAPIWRRFKPKDDKPKPSLPPKVQPLRPYAGKKRDVGKLVEILNRVHEGYNQ